MRDGLRWGRGFIPAYIVGVHTLSLLLTSRVAHDRATEDNYTQQEVRREKYIRKLTKTCGYST